MTKWIYFLLIFALPFGASAQELQASINISTPQVTTVDPKIFKTLQEDLQDMLNSQSWTNVRYEEHERIRANFQINIVSDDARNTFEANIQLQVTRPVYGSDYKTVLITFLDKGVNFTYEPYQPLQKTTTNFVNGLSSLFSFYAYMIIGLDYESFENLGGNNYFSIAQEIMNTIPNQQAQAMSGWLPSENKNNGRSRYWLLENLLNSRMTSFREGYYLYHRQGLDLMSTDPIKARANILEALKKIKISNDRYLNSFLVQVFCRAKQEEIIEIFKAAGRSERQEVYNLMEQIDKSNAPDYKVLIS